MNLVLTLLFWDWKRVPGNEKLFSQGQIWCLCTLQFCGSPAFGVSSSVFGDNYFFGNLCTVLAILFNKDRFVFGTHLVSEREQSQPFSIKQEPR